ncbi:MAG TPA: class I lanthipeptide [Mycobacteriales bacterium]|jgi:hypothetical protein
MRRKLTLRRETLAPLSAEDLAVVAGGDATGGCPFTMHLKECLSLYEACGTGPETTSC